MGRDRYAAVWWAMQNYTAVIPSRITRKSSIVKRRIPLMIIAVTTLLVIGAAVLSVREDSSARLRQSTTPAIPLPVKEALTVVSSYHGLGPLAVDPNAGSVVNGVWTSTSEGHSAGVLQHWSLRATDKSGPIVLGITVLKNGTEDVDAWVPGASHSNSWLFNATNGSIEVIHHVTVAGTTWTMRSSSTKVG